MKHFSISRLFDNKTFTKIFSIVAAVIIWAAVTLTIATKSERYFRNIPIDFSVTGTALEALGLSAFDQSESSVNVRLSGTRSALNAISKDNFSVSLNTARVSAAGKYTVSIDVSLKDYAGTLEILDYSPHAIQVTFDRLASKTLSISADISDLSAEEGYMLDKGYPASPDVTITGPESVINTISSCVADVHSKKTVLSKTVSLSSTLTLYDENGNMVTDPNITLDKESVDVSVPVLKIRDLPVVAHFVNQPSTFAEKDFSYSLSVSKIKVAGQEETIDGMSQLDIRYADLKTMKPGDKISLPVNRPSGFVNVDNIDPVEISVPSANMTEKSLAVSNFNVIGTPDDKKVRVITRQLNNVVLVGEKGVINSITANDVVVEVDLSKTTLSNGTMTVPATISVPGKSGVFWAYGTYEVVIRIS